VLVRVGPNVLLHDSLRVRMKDWYMSTGTRFGSSVPVKCRNSNSRLDLMRGNSRLVWCGNLTGSIQKE